MINDEEVKQTALVNASENGIVFPGRDRQKSRVVPTAPAPAKFSREGVQRDLLPLVEGCTVNTRYGTITHRPYPVSLLPVRFTLPSRLTWYPNCRGRLPIRVELRALSAEDFQRILTEPDAALTRQYQALLATEGVDLSFSDDAIKRLAEIAFFGQRVD